MSKYEKAELTNMCMIYDGAGRVVVQDKVGKNWGGITFPGGHVEKDESFVDSVIREVKEETGLDIQSPKLCGIKWWEAGHGRRYISCCSKPTATPARCMILTKAKCFGPN